MLLQHRQRLLQHPLVLQPYHFQMALPQMTIQQVQRSLPPLPQPKLLLHPQKLPLLHLPSMHVKMGAMDATQGPVEYVSQHQALVTGHVTVVMGMSVLKGVTIHT